MKLRVADARQSHVNTNTDANHTETDRTTSRNATPPRLKPLTVSAIGSRPDGVRRVIGSVAAGPLWPSGPAGD